MRTSLMVWWGADLVQLYNDACADLIGQKHPMAVGQPAAECWHEVWSDLVHLVGRSTSGGSAHAHELPLLMHRRGYLEETFWTLSLSPVRDELGVIRGVLVAVNDATDSVVRARRLQVLYEIGSAFSTEVASVEDVLDHACATLSKHPGKVAFAVARAVKRGGHQMTVVDTIGVDDVTDSEMPGDEDALAAVRRQRRSIHEFAPDGGWPVPPTRGGAPVSEALHLPVIDRSEDRVVGVLTVGINPHRILDDGYRDFLELMARQLTIATTDALAFRRERGRAAALAELDRTKSRFLQDVSHEFRTPLTLISGSHRSLTKLDDLPGAVFRDVAVAERAVERLTRLVDGLFDLARADEGALEPSLRPTDLTEVTMDTVSMFTSMTTNIGIDLVRDIAVIGDPVLVDPDMWAKIVSNLIGNALKFTDEGTVRVALHADPDADEIVLRVSDTGIGIGPEQMCHVFERFYHVSGTKKSSAEGAGIGLALVHDLVSIHDGNVDLDSELGRGSTFTVRIPHRVANSTGPEPTTTSEDLHVHAGATTPADDPRLHAAGGTWHDDSDAPTVLVVEDDVDMRRYLVDLLEEDGWNVAAVADVPAALTVETAPDLVLSDLMLPGTDGIELVRILRDHAHTAEIPIVLLTAQVGAESVAEGIEAGATDYLTKPFDPDEMRVRIRAHADLYRQRNEALRAAGMKIEDLERALETNRQIGAAIGIAMAFHGLDQAEAFDVLRRASQAQNRKLREIADEVVFTGVVPS